MYIAAWVCCQNFTCVADVRSWRAWEAACGPHRLLGWVGWLPRALVRGVAWPVRL